ncbi:MULTISPECIES: ATP-binding protein [unclassified Streptomyces]|uniref:ATP-binding protein n=1 Tax=unclassified Streptomyces TaxID=2593676 RepID=UPI001F042BD9|nr:MULTISPECIES: ATP-binding protein [unclassified Streptomyces]MCH0565184.1 ATP-binding protein [Streptomyces sp. MUM 2J]MCH0568267.1 ATP-binding protein [Streptomyces sp. MUM 136J]
MRYHRSQFVEAPAPLVRPRLPNGAPAVRTALPGEPAPEPTYQALLALPAAEDQVRRTRDFTSRVLDHWCVASEDRESAVLIVSELAANAARHGRSEMTLRLALHRPVLNIAVADTGRPRPSGLLTECADPDEHGRGLCIVEALAHWFDIHETDDSGFRVDVDLLLADPES